MRLVRIRRTDLARVVAAGVRRHNGVCVSWQRILSQPHYAIRVNRYLAGWIGYERRGAGL